MDSTVTIITGPIGSGKSTACRYIQKKDFKTVDLDLISKDILESTTSLGFLKENFSECLNGNKINRKSLADLVFTNSEKLKTLEGFLHPLVTLQVATLIQETNGNLFIEASAPKNIHKLYKTIVIFADEQTRRNRLRSRGMTRTDIDNRINTQPDESWWRSLGKVIVNTSYKELEAQIDNILEVTHE